MNNFSITDMPGQRGKTVMCALCLPLLILITLSGCSKQHETESKQQSAPLQHVSDIKLESVKVSELPDTFEVTGTVRARTSAMVSTRIPGVISIMRVREGDRVKKGQLLLQLDAHENQATAGVATAGIEEAQRVIDEGVARKKLAYATFERYQQLYKEQAISRQEYDIKQTENEMATQNLARAQARLKQAQQGAKAATTVADYTRIVAPISGVVVSRQADLGGSVFPGQPIMTIEDDGTYQLELAIPETMAAKVRPGTPVQVTMDAISTVFASKISEIVPAADPASRTFTAKIALNQKGLKSGMFGRGTIGLGTGAKGIMIPKSALLERGSLVSVWVVDKEKIARLRLVKTGKTSAERVEVLSGLSDGEQIAISALDKISDGAKVD